VISTRESTSYCYYDCHKTSHHCTTLRLRDRSGAPSIFPDANENTEIIRLIAQTIPHIFWIKSCEPPTGRCNLRQIVKEIRASSKAKLLFPFRSFPSSLRERFPTYINLFFLWWLHLVCGAEATPIYTSPTKHAAPPSLVSDWGESLLFNRGHHFASSGQKNQ
jgi:hypothetical protein